MSPTTVNTKTIAAGLLFIALASTNANALEGTWQIGLNAGVSRLSPETEGSGFTLDKDQSSAVSAYFSLDVTPIISADIAFTDLGEAELSQNEIIGYQAISIGATAYILGEKEASYRSEGASTYLRFGLSAIENDSGIDLNESDNVALWLGLGLQYPMSPSWGFRAELSSFDGDAQALMAGVFWRIGASTDEEPLEDPVAIPNPLDGTDEPTESARTLPTEEVTPDVPTPQPGPEVLEQPAIMAPKTAPVQAEVTEAAPVQPQPEVDLPTPPAQQPETVDVEKACPPAAAAVIPESNDCLLLNSVVTGLNFVGNTATMTSLGALSLDRVVAALKDYPSLTVEIRVHTQSLGDAQEEAQLSAERAKSVARYLVQNGVPVRQLTAKAFGAKQPFEGGSSPRQNNRVELRSR